MNSKPYILILSLIFLRFPAYLAQSYSSNSDQITSLGLNNQEKQYLTIWETTCLSEVNLEIQEDETDTERDYQFQAEDNEYFPNLKKKEYFLYLDIFKKVEIDPFFEAVMASKPIRPLDMNFRGFLIFVLVFVAFLLITFVIFCVFTFSKLADKKIRHRDFLLKACFAIPFIFITIAFLLTIGNFFYISEMIEIENNLLCEATRIPHTLLYGNPEIYLNMEKSKNFLGFETIRKYINGFLNESDSFQSGENYNIIKELENINIDKSVNELFETTYEFFSHFESKMIVNSSGERGHPLTILHSLPPYKNFLTEMLDRYKIGGDRLDSIVTLSPSLSDSNESSNLITNLRYSNDELLKIQQHLSMFWNQMLTASFDNTLVFKIAVIGVVLQCTVMMISVLLMCYIMIDSIWRGQKIKNKKVFRFLMILVCLIILLSSLSLFEVARGVFSSVYGCSVMYQLKKYPKETKTKITSFLQKDEIMNNIFNKCFFGEYEDHTQNFYSIFDKENTKTSIQEFLEFMDGIKMVHEEINMMDSQYDTRLTESMGRTFQSYKDGELYDFKDVMPNILKLNSYFECSEIFYSLSEKNCNKLPVGKTKCIKIKTDQFESPDCVDKSTLVKELFDNLQAYIQAEDELMEEILFKLNRENNPKSLLNLIKKVINEFEDINIKVKNLNTKLNTHFEELGDGPLQNWLDCGVIQDEIQKSFNNICDSKIEDLTNFVNLNLAVFLISFFSLIIFFILTFCLEEETEDDKKSEQPEVGHNYQNMSTVMDESKLDEKEVNITEGEIEQVKLVDIKTSGKEINFDKIGL